MITIGMDYRVLPGKESVFEAACRRVLGVMEQAPGHAESRLYRRVDDGGDSEYLIVSRWEDAAAFDAFIASDTFRKVTSWGLENVLAGPPRHTTYRDG